MRRVARGGGGVVEGKGVNAAVKSVQGKRADMP